MSFLLNGIQGLVNLLFFVAIVGTIAVSWVYASRLRKQHNADFPWNKTAMIVGIEIALWIAFTIFWEILKAFWLPIAIVTIIVLWLISRNKRRRYV